MPKTYGYELTVTWNGNLGTGTSGAKAFSRMLTLESPGKTPLTASADTPFHGDEAEWNPEEMLLGALSSCHMLSYFYVAVQRGFVVLEYVDTPTATLTLDRDGSGAITVATLRPRVVVADARMRDAALAAHEEAARLCFIANSVRFPVICEPEVTVAE